MQKFVFSTWNSLFNHEASPLRHIPDVATRHLILQVLAWMWVVAFSTALGSYTFFAASLVGHVFLLGAVAITVATYSAAATRPAMFRSRGRTATGEHE